MLAAALRVRELGQANVIISIARHREIDKRILVAKSVPGRLLPSGVIVQFDTSQQPAVDGRSEAFNENALAFLAREHKVINISGSTDRAVDNGVDVDSLRLRDVIVRFLLRDLAKRVNYEGARIANPPLIYQTDVIDAGRGIRRNSYFKPGDGLWRGGLCAGLFGIGRRRSGRNRFRVESGMIEIEALR